MKETILRSVFMALFFIAFFAVGELKNTLTEYGVSDYAQITGVIIVCWVVPMLGLLSWAFMQKRNGV